MRKSRAIVHDRLYSKKIMEITIPEAIKQLHQIVKQLQEAYPKKKFTLDGRLVGDLGEVLAQSEYEIELHNGLQKHHDARAADGRLVQIKATMQDSLTFPVDHVPDYYLGVKIEYDGRLTEIFNGPGSVAFKAIKNRRPTKTNLHSININTLKHLNEEVHSSDRIPRRARKPISI
jgi:hypothetical protein